MRPPPGTTRALAPELQKLPLARVISAAEAFALGDYTVALMQGSALDAKARQRIAEQVRCTAG
jgi:hypothetical protein